MLIKNNDRVDTPYHVGRLIESGVELFYKTTRNTFSVKMLYDYVDDIN